MKTPDTEKCEHKVVKKYCFRCKRPDLAGNVKNTPDTAHAVYQSTEADKCPKCGEDHRLISRCKTPDTEGGCCKGCKTATNKSEWDKGNVYCSNRECKCHTPDTEWEAKMLVETLHSILADISSFEPDGEVYTLVEQAHTELAKLRTLLTSRDTYWKERVIEKYGSYTCPCGCKETLEEAITNEDNLK